MPRIKRVRGSSTPDNSFRATFNGTNQSSKVEKLLSRAIIKTIDNASVTLHWLMNFAAFLVPHISPHIQLDNSIRFSARYSFVPLAFFGGVARIRSLSLLIRATTIYLRASCES